MIKRELSDQKQYNNFLSFIETIRKKDIFALEINIVSLGLSEYIMELYEYDKHLKPAKRWKQTGNWKRGYTIGFDPIKDYRVKEGVKYLLRFTFIIQKNIEVYYHVYIEI